MMENLIKRQAVLDWLENEWDGIVVHLFDGIERLPSAQPKRTEERTETHACDCISRQAAIDAIRNIKAIKGTSDDKILLIDKAEAQTELMMLPSAQPERKTGRWINVNNGKWNTVTVFKCSVCGEIDNRMYETDNYCPNCGSLMEAEHEAKKDG